MKSAQAHLPRPIFVRPSQPLVRYATARFENNVCGEYSAIGGGSANFIDGEGQLGGFIGGGEDDVITGSYDFIGAGVAATIVSGATDSFIGAGSINTIDNSQPPPRSSVEAGIVYRGNTRAFSEASETSRAARTPSWQAAMRTRQQAR